MEAKTGDIIAHISGGCGFDGKFADTYTIFEVPEKSKAEEGFAMRYRLDGKSYLYKWAHYENSFILDPEKLPEGFLYSFRNGLEDFSVHCEHKGKDIYELIDLSDWKKRERTPEKVALFKKQNIIKFETFQELDRQWNDIFPNEKGTVPMSIVAQIKRLFQIKEHGPSSNGEFFGSIMSDYFLFQEMYKCLTEWRKEGILKTMTREKAIEMHNNANN